MKIIDGTGRTDIKSLTYDELAELLHDMDVPSYRADQLYEWMHVKLVRSFGEMTNLPQILREALSRRCFLTSLSPIRVQTSKADGTKKYLLELSDGNCVESVMMRYHHGVSVCISSQVGCRMGCRFCASTIGGFVRNLSPSEMLDQVYCISRDTEERVDTIVVMGTGEPLDNYDNLVAFIRMVTDKHGLNISQRNITVSTCGIVPNMRKLSNEGLSVTLALSLHASNQTKRESIMPAARRYELNDILAACDFYFKKTGRRVTYEYALIDGINDTDCDAKELILLLKDRNCHINLIPVNPISERDYRRPGREAALAFQHKLIKGGINATIRREMGQDIDGACGQLRRRYEEG